MIDMKQIPTDAQLTDEWLKSIGGVWRQMEFEPDSIRFRDGERVMDVMGATVRVWAPGKPETHAAVVHWIKTRADFAWACRVFNFDLQGVD